MNMNNHRLRILTKHIGRWLEANAITQSVVAQEIVDHFNLLGLDKTLQVEDIFFMNTGDVFADVNTNRQKIFRWLGLLDNGAKCSPARLFYVEQAIVAAMPEPIRLAYLNEVFSGSGVCFSVANGSREYSRLDKERVAESMIKEDSEAQIAVLGLGANPTFEKVEKAYVELKESVGTQLSILDMLTEQYPELAPAHKKVIDQSPLADQSGEARNFTTQ